VLRYRRIALPQSTWPQVRYYKQKLKATLPQSTGRRYVIIKGAALPQEVVLLSRRLKLIIAKQKSKAMLP
jgi:hypothetical protein